MRSIFFSSFEYLSFSLALAAIYRPKDLHETLITDLLKPHRHDPRVRPVENPAEVVNVTIGLSIQMIENLVCHILFTPVAHRFEILVCFRKSV